MLPDAGKRFDALDGAFRAGGKNRGGSLREGSGGPILLDTRPGGFSILPGNLTILPGKLTILPGKLTILFYQVK